MIKAIHSVTRPTISETYTGSEARYVVIQMIATGDDGASVKAVADLEGSVDNKNWVRIATLTAEGTKTASDGGPMETFWPLYRINVTEVTNCVVDAYFAKGH